MSPIATPHASPRVTPSLGWFVSLSLLLHLGLLWGVLAAQSPILGGSAQEQTTNLAVRLLQHSAPVPVESRPQPAAVKPVAAKPNPVTKKKPATELVHATARSEPVSTAMEVEPQRPASSKAALPVATGSEDAALQQHLKVTLQQALADHFRYPLLARRRGWQGEVVLAFRLEADGRILDARIARSSGYGVLDHAALAALGKVKRLERGMPRSLTMQLPVIYRLEG
jgi:protein TonB